MIGKPGRLEPVQEQTTKFCQNYVKFLFPAVSGVFGQRWSTLQYLQKCKYSQAQSQLQGILDETLEGIKSAGTWKEERIIVSPQKVAVMVQSQKSPILNFCANNYLGLAVRISFASNHGQMLLQ